jgi:hypothetical protein
VCSQSTYKGRETWLLQIMLFIYVCSTWSIVEIKTCFETWTKRNGVNGVSLFHLSHLITLIAYLCSQKSRDVKIMNFIFDWSIYRLFVLNRGWKCASLRKYLLHMKHGSNKKAFWGENNLKWRKWCKFVSPPLCNNTYGLSMVTMDTKRSSQVFYVSLVDLQGICAK